ncbi:hypothetical protein K443DRAFT_125419 [Laccaria amethystina LaAM-08-1]|uniref:Uncharacterized protein n=1 Tax=Laccaria amethystina LaAM-08-1 TaxID=1095629 RepID=A0A0C9WJ28_9AGAR|nr:hypothetical protein K443DRAFT_125419 [Laccaria amethystina LaAM-08-1]
MAPIETTKNVLEFQVQLVSIYTSVVAISTGSQLIMKPLDFAMVGRQLRILGTHPPWVLLHAYAQRSLYFINNVTSSRIDVNVIPHQRQFRPPPTARPSPNVYGEFMRLFQGMSGRAGTRFKPHGHCIGLDIATYWEARSGHRYRLRTNPNQELYARAWILQWRLPSSTCIFILGFYIDIDQ